MDLRRPRGLYLQIVFTKHFIQWPLLEAFYGHNVHYFCLHAMWSRHEIETLLSSKNNRYSRRDDRRH